MILPTAYYLPQSYELHEIKLLFYSELINLEIFTHSLILWHLNVPYWGKRLYPLGIFLFSHNYHGSILPINSVTKRIYQLCLHRYTHEEINLTHIKKNAACSNKEIGCLPHLYKYHWLPITHLTEIPAQLKVFCSSTFSTLEKMWEENDQCDFSTIPIVHTQEAPKSYVSVFSQVLTLMVLHFQGNLLKITQTSYLKTILIVWGMCPAVR